MSGTFTVLLSKAEGRRETDLPQIVLNWSCYIDTKGLDNCEVSSAINIFLATTIGAGHVKKMHHGKRMPKVLFDAKMAKVLKKTEDNFNENVFKNFSEAEGGQVSLAAVSFSRFHENAEA